MRIPHSRAPIHFLSDMVMSVSVQVLATVGLSHLKRPRKKRETLFNFVLSCATTQVRDLSHSGWKCPSNTKLSTIT
eukprot:3067459-Amphidinium_carterae.1